jgi:tRNA dimethylallyltransferase
LVSAFGGVLTAGYKEFADLPLPQERPFDNPKFKRMLDQMKLSTHRYAKYQIRWITKQLLPAVHEARSHGGDVHVYVVPGGPAGEPLAQEVLAAFLRGQELPDAQKVGHPDAGELLKILAAEPARVADTAE